MMINNKQTGMNEEPHEMLEPLEILEPHEMLEPVEMVPLVPTTLPIITNYKYI